MSSESTISYSGEDSCRVARVIASLGGTYEDLAAAFMTDVATVRRWRRTYREFAAALEVAQDEAPIERTLARRALGYSLPTEIVFRKRNGTTVRAKSVKYVPPDVAAAELWLSNYRPDLPSKQGLVESCMVAYLQSLREPAPDASSAESSVARYRGTESCRPARIIGRLGGTEVELADALGVSLSVMKQWKLLHPELSVALDEGRAGLRGAIENALRRRAAGYRYETEDVVLTPRGNIVRTKSVKHLEPNMRAARLLLKNRITDFDESITLDEVLDKLDDATLKKVIAELKIGAIGSALPNESEPSAPL